jgi:hypothetical protein
MKHVKTIGACAIVALAAGATTATADSLITGGKIKNGTVAMRDLTPGVQALIKKHAKDGVNGVNGAAGAKGATGANGNDGAKGDNGAKGDKGQDGSNGRSAVSYTRVTSAADSEVSIANGVANLEITDQYGYAGVRTSVKNTKVSELAALSFKANASDEGITWLKVTTSGHGSIVFSPNTQEGGERLHEQVTYNVRGEGATARWNDDKGMDKDMTWSEIVAEAGDRNVKEITVYAGYAGPLGDDDLGSVQVDDLTVNHEVIDFE